MKRATKDRVKSTLPDFYLINLLLSMRSYYSAHGRIPNIFRPQTHNEIMLYKKVRDRSVLKRFVTDKEFAKIFISGVIGKYYTPKQIAIIRSDSMALLDQKYEPCVIKPTHLSGSVVILDESRHLRKIEKDEIRNWFRQDQFWITRERNYKYLEPKAIIEEIILHNGGIPKDFKVFCFHGVPRIIEVDVDRFTNHTRAFYDTDWRRQNISVNFPNYEGDIEKPNRLMEMLELASTLSSFFDFIRVDFYHTENLLMVGELTCWPANCLSVFTPREADLEWGRFWERADS